MEKYDKVIKIIGILIIINLLNFFFSLEIFANDMVFEESLQENTSNNAILFTSQGSLETQEKAYDYGINPDTYPLPIKDYEIIYNPSLKVLTYRFKDDSIGADGLRENQVSERLISRLIERKTTEYEIDMQANEQIEKFVVEIPYSIYQTFKNREISIKIKTNRLNLILPPDFLDVSSIKEFDSFGRDSTIKFVLEENPYPYPQTSPYVLPIQKLSFYISTPNENISLENLGKKFEIQMKIDKIFSWSKENINIIKATNNIETWEPIESQFDSKNGLVKFYTYDTGFYSAIFSNIT